MSKTILVCGGRKFFNREFVYQVLDITLAERGWDLRDVRIVTGDATGADSLAIDWAIARRCNYKSYQAHWWDLTQPGAVIRTRRDGSKYDARAGCRRNQRILDEERGPIALCIAFPGGNGTNDMISRARVAGIEVLTVSPKVKPKKIDQQDTLFS